MALNEFLNKRESEEYNDYKHTLGFFRDHIPASISTRANHAYMWAKKYPYQAAAIGVAGIGLLGLARMFFRRPTLPDYNSMKH